MPFLTDSNPPAYNGYTFPTSVETVQFSGEPVQDESNRVTMFVRHVIGLKWDVIAAAGSNIDSTMASLRATLMQRGGDFTYANRGMGADFNFNSSGLTDVQGGPIPRSFDFKPKGKNQGCTVTWTVEICVPTQCAAFNIYGVLMTFNYKLKIKIDRHGYTSRTYSGFFQVPKVDSDFSVGDAFIESVMPPIPEQFQRVDRDYDHSYDKKRVDFSFVDEQMTSRSLPEGCTAATGSHDLGSDLQRGFQTWNGTISASYTVAPPYDPGSVGWAAFKALLDSRLQTVLLAVNADPPGNADVNQQKPTEKPKAAIVGLQLSEPDIYSAGGTNVSFSAQIKMICSIKAIFGNDNIKSGMWKYPLQGSEAWTRWRDSLPDVLRARGLANLSLSPTDEVLVDLCVNNAATPPQQEAEFTSGDIGVTLGDITDLQPTPDTETSWFGYEPEIEIYEDNHAVVSSSLTEDSWSPYDQSPGDFSPGYIPDQKPSDPTDSVQYRAPSTLYVFISGQAMRAWYPIHRPKIVNYAGLQVKEVSTIADGCFWRQKIVGSLGIGMPIYYAEWRFKYAVEARPAQAILPPTSRAEQT